MIWSCVAALALLGAAGLSSDLLKLWDLWTDDPLRSIGMLIVAAGIVLAVGVWRQSGWELKGTWWGLAPATVALAMSAYRHSFGWTMTLGLRRFDLFAPRIALYVFASGFVLLFAGPRIWRRAWFPLALLLCAQPVPDFAMVYGDLPLQNISAHIARSFAVLIGFPPTSKELLRLMFTPDFGMFIAPGCDGVRGALTLGYLALITGYLKRVSVLRWICYVAGGVLLGYLFNLIRLCALVVYYRVASGHPRLEAFATNADYIIGGCLFLIASLLFLWVATRKSETTNTEEDDPQAELTAQQKRLVYWRAAVFAAPVLFFIVPGVNALRTHRKSFAAEVRDGIVTRAQLDGMMPKQFGGYLLNRSWQEIKDGRILVESGAYDGTASDEAVIGVWLPSHPHNMHSSWIGRGEDPLLRGDRTFATAEGSATTFDVAFYSDGISDSIAGNAFCTPASCFPSQPGPRLGMHFMVDPPDFESAGKRAVPIFFRIDRPRRSGDRSAIYQELTVEARQFLAGVDLGEVSRRFQ
ncbi:MAG TPA: exosortase J [Acidobacteriaceae bacterium]|nr:exosortase J [Acidobacteriaceae bacterium]